MRKASLLLFLLFLCQHLLAQYPEYGLHIQSYPLQTAQYTSMSLEDGKPIETKGDKITLAFNLWVRNDNVFGTVLRIITNTNQNIDLMFSVGENDKRFPILVTGNVVNPIQKEARRETWVAVQLTLQPKTGEVSINYDGTQLKSMFPDLIDVQSLRISFGYCPFDKFTLADIASVNLKDVSLRRGDQEIRFWKMARHNEHVCYDERSQSVASGKNTRWIIDQYITWKPIYSKAFTSSPSIAFDPTIGTFYMATHKRELYVFHSDEGITDTIRVKGGEFVANYPNQLIYIPQRQQLLSYNLNENLYSAFDPSTQTWEEKQEATKDHDYWNNSLVYCPANASLISFGGYGHYHYNNELLISYPWDKSMPQRRMNLTNIHPRYSAASVIVDSTLYIFGGRGCPTGRQELSPRNYYDLYAVNLLTLQANKLWEAPQAPESGEFQPSENMIYDPENRCFYVFCSQQGGILMRVNLDKPHFEPMSLPINLKMEAQYIYSNLYYSAQQKKLYAVVHQAEVSGKAFLNIYEINYPPISIEAFKQAVGEKSNADHNTTTLLWAVAVAFLLFSVAGTYLYLRNKKSPAQKKPTKDKPVEQPQSLTNNLDKISDINDITISTGAPEFHNYDFSKQCICFFGGFKVIDREGTDITNLFTPTLKTLLILLILYTGKDSKGIIGHKMIQILWYDKSEDSAKNNRNVYMSKLRSLLEKVGDVKILNQNGFWNIQFESGTICDYLEALQLYKENNGQNLEKLIELLLHGIMLPNMETDWIDAFKNDFSNTTIDLLCCLLKREDLSDILKLKIADTMFQHDYINEEALCVKCRILSEQGKKGLAKTVYDAFCKEYNASMGTEYKYSLMEVIGHTQLS